eukprot:5775436-Amphidinium_carterae.1
MNAVAAAELRLLEPSTWFNKKLNLVRCINTGESKRKKQTVRNLTGKPHKALVSAHLDLKCTLKTYYL